MKLRYPLLMLAGMFFTLVPAAVWSQPAGIVYGGYGSGTARVIYYNGAFAADECSCGTPQGPVPTATTYAGFGLLWSLDPLVGGMSLITRLSASNTRLDWIRQMPDALVLPPGQTGPFTQRVERRIGYSLRDFGLESLVLFRAFAGLDIGFGGSIGAREITGFRFTQHLMEPANARFVNVEGYPSEDRGRTLVYSDGSTMDFDPLALQGIASAFYTIEIDESVAIIPEVDFRVDLAAPVTRSDWDWTSASGIISFRYSR